MTVPKISCKNVEIQAISGAKRTVQDNIRLQNTGKTQVTGEHIYVTRSGHNSSAHYCVVASKGKKDSKIHPNKDMTYLRYGIRCNHQYGSL